MSMNQVVESISSYTERLDFLSIGFLTPVTILMVLGVAWAVLLMSRNAESILNLLFGLSIVCLCLFICVIEAANQTSVTKERVANVDAKVKVIPETEV